MKTIIIAFGFCILFPVLFLSIAGFLLIADSIFLKILFIDIILICVFVFLYNKIDNE